MNDLNMTQSAVCINGTKRYILLIVYTSVCGFKVYNDIIKYSLERK